MRSCGIRCKTVCGLAALVLLMATGCAQRPIRFGPTRLYGLKGVCHLTSLADTERQLSNKLTLAKQAGITHCRGPIVQPWMLDDWNSRVHHILDQLRAHSITPMIEIQPGTGAELTDIVAWRRFVRRAVRLFPAPVYGICNEADNDPQWTPDRYARWLHVAAQEIRAQSPKALISAPELGHGKAHSMEAVLKALDPDDYDILSIHPYDLGWRYVRRALVLVPDKDCWITEDGSISSLAPAYLRGSFYEYLQSPRIKALFVYAFYDTDRRNYVWNMLEQVSETEYQPKSTYRAVAEIK